ncbi:hypothetical protein TIFTF001_023886 [Ficus carica]|uniref:Uncharacterized protein n=1 Tax=Ficus carica TaxID=3494 RepID=A0AA88DK96_FICCA|nr:hypothetical protein TIFTF001_023886 [Ficus carica]
MNDGSSGSNQEEDVEYNGNEKFNRDEYLLKAVVAATARMRNRRRAPQPMHNSILTGSMRVEELLNGHEDIIQGLISMKSDTFRSLSNLLGGNVDVNADYVLDDGIDDTGPSVGTQPHESSWGAMNRMRDVIADEMWERYQASPWYKFR